MSHRFHLSLLLTLFPGLLAGCGTNGSPAAPDASGTQDAGSVTDRVDAGEAIDRVTVVEDIAAPPVDTAPPPTCARFDFLGLMNNQILRVSDDADQNCANGFARPVQLVTNAPDGTPVQLYVNGRETATATVAGLTVRFNNVSLDVGATSVLEVRQAEVAQACQSVSVSVNCALPRCQITQPDHAALNLADSVNSAGPFTTRFNVETDIEEGREVSLVINARDPLRAAVVGGVATFSNIELAPDGMFRVRANCTNAASLTGTSAETVFTVDSTPPTLQMQRPMMNTTFGVSSDTNTLVAGVQFRVCGRSDALGQPLCASIDGAAPTCSPAATTDTCVELTCPSGGAPFDVNVAVTDVAGNPTRQTITGLRCQSSLPSVRLVAPQAYDPSDATTVLNASRDRDPMTPGLQTDVVACTDRASGSASLVLNDDTTPMATVMVGPTAAGDPCATLGMGFIGIARFPRVTLPETFPARTNPDAPSPAGPSIQAAITDAEDTGVSAPSLLYVDSIAPVGGVLGARRVVTASPSCAAIFGPTETDGSASADVRVVSDTYPVTLTLTRDGEMPTTLTLTNSTEAGGVGTFASVRFRAGRTGLSMTTADPAGNTLTTTASCSVEVGNPPQITFASPRAGAVFNTSAPVDVTLNTADVPAGSTVTLTVGTTTPLRETVATPGSVTFRSVTLPEGDAVTLTATVTRPDGATATTVVTVAVDTRAPTSVVGLAGAVPTTPASARRAGTVRLSWSDGSDPTSTGGTRAVTRYEIRRASTPVTVANFATATLVTTATRPGAPGAAGTADVTGLQLERAHYFGVRAFDAAGNASATVSAIGPITLNLARTTISDSTFGLGSEISGGYDVNGDGFADVVAATGPTATAGSGGIARVYFGSATGLSSTNYAEFRGNAALRFGLSATSIGDVNGDGRGDILIGEPGPNMTPFTAGSAYVYFGRANWRLAPSSYTTLEADVTISGGTGDFANALLGSTTTRVGDFNGDGINDIAVGAQTAAYSQGATSVASRGAVCVFLGRTTLPRTLSPNQADVVIRNATTDSFLGRFVAGGGRLLGNDTTEEILVGIGSASTAGAMAVIAGREVTSRVTIDVTGTTDASVFYRRGDATLGNRQFLVAGVGDVNGDGRGDMAVSAGTGQGVVSLLFGNANGGLDSETRVYGVGLASTDVFGARVASIVGPWQPRPSLLVPAPTAADLVCASGGYQGGDPRLYTLPGRAAWTSVTSSASEYTPFITGTSAQPMTAANWVGDVDGDGYPDLAFGQAAGASSITILR